ncbi:MAG: hypothetical protein P4L56_03620 [Candidatus Sulfopaludibacter sp.]|nr:hypothetical protein [Candidatus Sulfopaludibacter sp.]
MLSLLMLCSCANKGTTAGDRPHATVLMRDGTQVTGSVTDSNSAGITIAGDDGVTRTIPMAQVKMVDYGSAPAPAATQAGEQAETAAGPDPVHDNHYHPTESAITTKTFELPVGTRISVRNEETIDSARAVEGQTFPAEVTRDVRDRDGNVVIPRGSNTRIVIRSASKGGRFRGTSDLVLDLQTVSVDGREYELSTANLAERGRQGIGANKRTGEFAGGGAALGAIIGAIAGGGKGAAIGGGSGAGAGALTEVLTKGPAVRVPVESVLTFQLDRPLHLVVEQ